VKNPKYLCLCFVVLASGPYFSSHASEIKAAQSRGLAALPPPTPGCVDLANEKSLRGAERRKFIIGCAEEEMKRRDTPERRKGEALVKHCQEKFSPLRGQKEWVPEMAECLEPGKHKPKKSSELGDSGQPSGAELPLTATVR
jgi:hypothetical protein